jgi:hypothetical protein
MGNVAMRTESLPFTIRVVSNVHDLERAVRIRHAAYMRHVPDFGRDLRIPEATDTEPGVAVLLAESKLDKTPIGTMRIQTNEFSPLALEENLTLPDWLQGKRLAEASRLGVTHERVGRMVTMALFKAYYLYCQRQRIDWMVITARFPVDRHYERLLFKDVYPDLGYVPIKHVGNISHRVMSLQVGAAQDLWMDTSHPLLDYMVHTYHKDINVATTTIYEQRPRQEAPAVATSPAAMTA